MTDALPEQTEGRAVTYYTAVFALGTAGSFFAGGEVAHWLGWRWAFGVAATGCLTGAAITALVLRPAPPANPGARGSTAANFAQVFRNRQAMGYVIAFFGYAWEVFAFRVWIVVFLTFIQAREAEATYQFSPTHIATIVALCGVAANMVFGEMALAIGRRRSLIGQCLASMTCALLVGF